MVAYRSGGSGAAKPSLCAAAPHAGSFGNIVGTTSAANSLKTRTARGMYRLPASSCSDKAVRFRDLREDQQRVQICPHAFSPHDLA